jgi:ParB/RepB/Spo0J family partition protein
MAHNSTTGKSVKFDAKAQASGAVDKLFGARQGEQVVSGLKLIRHENIEVRPQPRTVFSSEEVAELARSITELRARGEGIEQTGILQPLLVTLLKNPTGARYRLIAGERRYRASQEAGLSQVPCLVLTMSEPGVLPAQLIENLQRQSLAPLDEAHAFQQLKVEQNLSLRDIAKSLGKTLGYVTNRVALLKMGPDIQRMVSAREDTIRAAHHIDRITDPTQRADLIQAVLEEGISEREVQRRIESSNNAGGDTESTKVFSRENTTTDNRPETGQAQNGVSNNTLPSSASAPDPILNSLQPAAKFVAEAARQIQELRLTADYRRQVQEAIDDVRRQLDIVEKSL